MSNPGPTSADESGRHSTPLRVRRVIAVGGCRGGAGSSTIAVNLAVYLVQLGRTVALVDADPSGATLHTLLDVPFPSQAPDADALGDAELAGHRTTVPGLVLIPQAYSTGSTVPLRPGRKVRWAQRLRHLEVDYVLLDLGAGTAPATLDLFLSADLGLCITAPDPPSIEATYRFTRALYQRRLRRTLVKDRFKLRLLERAQAELPPMPAPMALVRELARYDTSLSELATNELMHLRPRLVVNGVRLRTDGELGPAMCDMAQRYLGLSFEYLGHVEQDDSVWLSVVRRTPLLIDSPTSKSARNIERIARRIMALSTIPEGLRDVRLPLVPEELTLYDVLWTHRGASDEEIRRAYKRQREIFQPGSLPLVSLLTSEQLSAAQAELEEAHDTLLDPLRRRAYDVSIFPEDEEDAPKRDVLVDTALAAERAMLRQELTREIHAETEFTGKLLAKVRESLGIELEEIANHTKISASHLRAIEAEQFASLPALVYTRGFVQQVARYLRLDPAQVTRTYLRRMREWAAHRGEGSQ